MTALSPARHPLAGTMDVCSGSCAKVWTLPSAGPLTALSGSTWPYRRTSAHRL